MQRDALKIERFSEAFQTWTGVKSNFSSHNVFFGPHMAREPAPFVVMGGAIATK